MKKTQLKKIIKESIKEMRSSYGVHDTYGASPRQRRNLSGLPGVMEFEQPKSFDPDTLSLVREMLFAADVYHNDLVGGYDEVSSYLDKRTGGTIIKFPHMQGPPSPALFGKETTDKIDASKAKAKAAALKTYTKFKTYIEDYEISDKSPAGVYGNIYLSVMFNDLAKDYSAPKGGTQSSQFENKEFLDNPKLQPGKTVIYSGTRYKVIENTGYVLTLKSLESGNELKLNLGQLKDRPVKENQMKKIKKEGKSDYEVGYKDGDTAVLSIDDKTAMQMKAKPTVTSLKNLDTMANLKEKEIEEEPNEISYDDAKEKGLDNPDKADISKDKDISDYELKRGMAIQKAMDDQEKNEGHMELTNDIGKDDYVDDEGRMAKSQMYKTGKYAMKLHDMLDDMEQLPAWVQAKLTKASDYLSAVYHYLDYEFARRGDNLMENMDKHRKRSMLMEGATEKLFKLFNAGKTDAEVRAHYLQMQVDMPESFISKLRNNWESLRKTKLDLTLADKEAEGFDKIQPEPSVSGMEGGEVDGMEEDKQLASGLFTK